MDGILVGKRVIGAQSPVTIGWENIPKVEGGPAKRFFFIGAFFSWGVDRTQDAINGNL